jgi:hypothetical protein
MPQHTCHQCKDTKDESEFHTFKKVKTCKKCNNKIHYQNHKSYYLAKGDNRRSDPKLQDSFREYNRKWIRDKRANDIQYKIKGSLRNRMFQALKGIAKSKGTEKLLGCSWAEFMTHIESQFTEGMNWENYGKGNDKWNLDHIIPLAAFDLSIPENQEKASHFTNLQPMWQTDNFKKGDKILDIKS